MTHGKQLTDMEVELEIEKLRGSQYVKLAKKEENIRFQLQQKLASLRRYERIGKELEANGYTIENIKERMMGV